MSASLFVVCAWELCSAIFELRFDVGYLDVG